MNCSRIKISRESQIAKENWGGFLLIVLALVVVTGVYHKTSIEFFFRKSTSTWSLAAFSVFAVMVYCERVKLSISTWKPSAASIALVFVLGGVWLVGNLMHVRLLTELTYIALCPASLAALFGKQWTATLLRPYFVLAIAIPLGEPLTSLLVSWTSNAVALLLNTSGISVFRDGSFILLSTGGWSIASTCSGIGFFNVSLLLGLFCSWAYKLQLRASLLFIGGAIVTSVVGNWLRVYVTIVIAHASENKLLRDDHESFGWLIFMAMITLYGSLALNYLWRFSPVLQVEKTGMRGDRSEIEASVASRLRASWYMIAGWLAALAFWPFISAEFVERNNQVKPRVHVIQDGLTWVSSRTSASPWHPILTEPRALNIQSFSNSGKIVDVHVAVFYREDWNSKLVSEANRIADTDSRTFTLIGQKSMPLVMAGKDWTVLEGIVLSGKSRVLVWQWFWIDSLATSSSVIAKMQQLKTTLLGKRQCGAWVTISAEATSSLSDARNTLRSFLESMNAKMEQGLFDCIAT